MRIEHHEVTRTRCPPGVDLQLQHADEVAADGLDSLEDRLLDVRLFAGGGDQPAHFNHVVQRLLEMLFQPRSIHQIWREAGLVEAVKVGDIAGHLDAPVDERPLRPDAGKQHRQQRAEDHIAASPQRGMHIAGRRPDHHRQSNADQQRLIGFLAQRQPAAEEHRRRAPEDHQRQGDELKLQRHQPQRRTEDRAADTLKRPRHDVTPEGDRPHHHHQSDERPGSLRHVQQPHQQKGEHKGQRNPHTMHHPIMAIQADLKWLE